jgi:sugar-phosphatase
VPFISFEFLPMLLTEFELSASCLLFDMDGTLLDSHAPVARAYTDWARRHGLDPVMVLRECQGRRVRDTVQALAPAGVNVDVETATLKRREFEDVAGVVEIPGAGAFLRSLPVDCWAIVTSAERGLALRRIEAAGLPTPSVLVTADDIAHGKPSPDGFVAAAKALGAAPARAVIFEDSAAGIAAGLAAGATVIALTTTVPVEKLNELNAFGHIHDLHGLTAQVDESGLLLRLTPGCRS